MSDEVFSRAAPVKVFLLCCSLCHCRKFRILQLFEGIHWQYFCLANTGLSNLIKDGYVIYNMTAEQRHVCLNSYMVG